MKLLVLAIILTIAISSCEKEYSYEAPPAQHKCHWITDKYLFEGVTPAFELGETPPLGDGAIIQVSQADYDKYKVGDWYCY
jgi:hypothetical protein